MTDAIKSAFIIYGVATAIGLLVALLISGLFRFLRLFTKGNK